jgi:hypothetical protein
MSVWLCILSEGILMAKRRQRRLTAATNPAWLRSFALLNDVKLTMKLTGGSVERQRSIRGLRRIQKSFSFHPDLLIELLTASAAMGETPALWLARKLAEDWGYRKEDI